MSDVVPASAIDSIIARTIKVTQRNQRLVSIGGGPAVPGHGIVVVATDEDGLRVVMQAIARAFTKSNIPVELANPSPFTPVRLSSSRDVSLYILGAVMPAEAYADANATFFDTVTKGPIAIDGKLSVPVSGTIFVCSPDKLLKGSEGGTMTEVNPLIARLRAAGQRNGGAVAVPFAVLLTGCERFPKPADAADDELTAEKVMRALSCEELTATVALFASRCSVPVSAVFKSAYHGELLFAHDGTKAHVTPVAEALAMPLLRALLSVVETATSRSTVEGDAMMALNRGGAAAACSPGASDDGHIGYNTRPLHLQGSLELATRLSQHVQAMCEGDASDRVFGPIGALGDYFVMEGIDGKALIDLPDERILQILTDASATLGMKRAIMSLIASSRAARQ